MQGWQRRALVVKSGAGVSGSSAELGVSVAGAREWENAGQSVTHQRC